MHSRSSSGYRVRQKMAKQLSDLQASLYNKKAAIATKKVEIDTLQEGVRGDSQGRCARARWPPCRAS
eukprot:2838880-Pyramimonas_sp.AAC.1